MCDLIEELFKGKTFQELQQLNKIEGEPYVPETDEEFDAMMKCWLPESDVPEKY